MFATGQCLWLMYPSQQKMAEIKQERIWLTFLNVIDNVFISPPPSPPQFCVEVSPSHIYYKHTVKLSR